MTSSPSDPPKIYSRPEPAVEHLAIRQAGLIELYQSLLVADLEARVRDIAGILECLAPVPHRRRIAIDFHTAQTNRGPKTAALLAGEQWPDRLKQIVALLAAPDTPPDFIPHQPAPGLVNQRLVALHPQNHSAHERIRLERQASRLLRIQNIRSALVQGEPGPF